MNFFRKSDKSESDNAQKDSLLQPSPKEEVPSVSGVLSKKLGIFGGRSDASKEGAKDQAKEGSSKGFFGSLVARSPFAKKKEIETPAPAISEQDRDVAIKTLQDLFGKETVPNLKTKEETEVSDPSKLKANADASKIRKKFPDAKLVLKARRTSSVDKNALVGFHRPSIVGGGKKFHELAMKGVYGKKMMETIKAAKQKEMERLAAEGKLGDDPEAVKAIEETIDEEILHLMKKPGSVFGKDQIHRLIPFCKRGDWIAAETLIKNAEKKSLSLELVDQETGYNALMFAVKDNKIQMAEKFLDLGVNINAQAKDGTTALFQACSLVKEDMIKLLIGRKADPMIPGGPKKQLPIHILCSRSTGAALSPLQILLRAMPKDAKLEKDGEGNIPLLLAVDAGVHGVCRELLSTQAKEQTKEIRPATGETCLHLAAKRRDPDLVKLMIDGGAPINHQDNNGITALHIIAQEGEEQMMKFFYQAGANPNLTDNLDRTPLHLAAEKGHNGVVEMLTEKFKASIYQRTKDGSTLMHIASAAGQPSTAMIFVKKGVPLHMPNKSGAKCLHTAALTGHVEVVKTLLHRGEEVDATTNDNYTALHIAVQANQPQVVETLLGYGAQVHIKAGQDGETPLHLAARIVNGERCAELLIKSGAEVNCAQNKGETPLHVAARFGHLKTVILLLEDGSQPDSQSMNGETPLHVAAITSHCPVATQLVDHWKKMYPDDNGSLLVNIPNNEGEISLHYAAQVSPSMTHYPNEDRELMKLLLKSGGDVNKEAKPTKETPIHYVCRIGNCNILEEILENLELHEIIISFNKQDRNGWSPLLYASDSGNPAVVKLLLQQHARIDVFDEVGKAALHLAAEKGHAEVVDILLANNAFVNSRSKKGLTPLHLAAQHGYSAIAKKLVASGAVLDGLTLAKQTPLHLAAESGQLDMCTTLLNMKADANSADNHGQTPLLLAAENDHPEVVKLFLRHKPELVSMANANGFTCAHIAAMKGSVAVIKELMKFNKSLVTTARNKTGNTALHLAAEGGHADVVKVLVQAGAPVDDENAEGYTALHLAAKYGHIKVLEALKTSSSSSWRAISRKTGLAAIHLAAISGQADFIREMLTQIPATIVSEKPAVAESTVEDYGLTPLHFASDHGHEGVVRLLLNSAGVQIDTPTLVQGSLPLHLSARGGHLAAAGLLLSRSTDQLHVTDKQGRTPLHLASAHGHRDMVGLLLGQGADMNAQDNNGWTPLHYTARYGFLEVVQLLVESGASPVAQSKEGKIPLCLAAKAGHYVVIHYLLKKEHDTQTLMEDKSFLIDLMVCGKTNSNKPVQEFVLVSAAPIDTAVKMASSYQLLALKEKDRARDLEKVSEYCEAMAVDLLSITAVSYNTGTLLRAVDHYSNPFLDVLIELQTKDVVAHPAVQKYLTDLWMGNLTWAGWKIILLFLGFLFCPVIWIAFSLPLGHRFSNIPIIKFMSYLVSHIFFIVILSFTIINPWTPLCKSATILPQPHEWFVVIWLIGLVIADLTNPKDREGLGWIKVVIMVVGWLGIAVHFLAFLFTKDVDILTILYIRNQFLAVALLLCFVEFLNFLTFHHLFGPWTVIIRDLIKDLMRFLAILIIFLAGFSLHVSAIYQPVRMQGPNCTILNENEKLFQSPFETFEMLFFALFGLVEPDQMPLVHQSPEFSQTIVKSVFGVYMMVTVVVLINLLIAMMSNTYQRIQERSDTEWKFGRAKLIRNMNKTSPSPAPINILILPYFVYQKIPKKRAGKGLVSPLDKGSKRSSLMERAVMVERAAPTISRAWIQRTRNRQMGKVAPTQPPQGEMRPGIMTTLARARPISKVVEWPNVVAKYLELVHSRSPDSQDEDKQ